MFYLNEELLLLLLKGRIARWSSELFKQLYLDNLIALIPRLTLSVEYPIWQSLKSQEKVIFFPEQGN